jgi:hypothetical protein
MPAGCSSGTTPASRDSAVALGSTRRGRRRDAAGNFNPVEITHATIQSGETPISIGWDYLNASFTETFAAEGVEWEVYVPADGLFGGYYSQAISKFAPHPGTPPTAGLRPALPEVEGSVEFPDDEQQTAAQKVVADRWNAEMSG